MEVPHDIKKREYEKTNSLSRCDFRLTSNSHLRRRTDIILKRSYSASSYTKDRLSPS